MPLKIDSMYAFIAKDKEGEEGVVGMKTHDGWIPMVGADMDRVNSLMPIAKMIAEQTGVTIKLYLFTGRTEITEIKTPS
jgi:hypothetical protein